MTRDEALEELKLRLSDKYMLQHSIVSEAIMREFASYYNCDEETWGLAGLLHDIDYERTVSSPMQHGAISADILENLDIDETIVYCVRAHNNSLGIPRNRKIDKVLFATDDMCDLLIKCALTLPNKKITDVTEEAVIKMITQDELLKTKYSDKLKSLDELDLTLKIFVEISVKAIQKLPSEFIYVQEN